MTVYDPEVYWTRVAAEIARRPRESMLSGDDDPFHAYQRRKMLRRFLDTVDVRGRTVLEVGCGPGGNLLHLQRARPRRTIGVDISSRMLDLARDRLRNHDGVQLLKTDGRRIDLEDRAADVTITVTMLMHITDEGMFGRLIAELCRVTRDTLVLIEQTTRRQTGTVTADRHAARRPISAYTDAVTANGLVHCATEDLRVRVSRMGYGYIQRTLGRAGRREGERENALTRSLGWTWLLASRWLDDLVPDDLTLTKVTFARADVGRPS